MDSKTGGVVATLPIGERVDAVAFDVAGKSIFASNGDGSISAIRQKNANVYESVGNIQTQKSAKTMALDPKSRRLFLSAAEMQASSASKAQTQRPKPKPGTFAVLVVEPQ
jgi:DNA-binding beta-propeller fold protein YncE